MKLIFLDCDGVLNNHTFPEVDPELRRLGGWRYKITQLDNGMVARAVLTLQEADAHLVVSSIWQQHRHHMQALEKKLQSFGFDTRERLLGGTDDMSPGNRRCTRGELMLRWVNELGTVSHWGAWDDSSVPEIGHHLVRTQSNIGLQHLHCSAMLELLGVSQGERA